MFVRYYFHKYHTWKREKVFADKSYCIERDILSRQLFETIIDILFVTFGFLYKSLNFLLHITTSDIETYSKY